MTMLNKSIAHIEIPPRMRKLPVSDRGYPIPWFVHYVPETGESDFRVIGRGKLFTAHSKKLCWLCGEKLGTYLCFTIGPMCTVNRVSAEPPSHRECAEYATKACPFLTQPRMKRNEADMPEEGRPPGGMMIKRNPGATALWITKSYQVIKAEGGVVFQIGDPTEVQWWAEGKTATPEQVLASFDSGLPILEQEAWRNGKPAIKEFRRMVEESKQWLPMEAKELVK